MERLLFQNECDADKKTRLGLPGVLTLTVVVASNNNVPRFGRIAITNPNPEQLFFHKNNNSLFLLD
jgi:hypothetical protein